MGSTAPEGSPLKQWCKQWEDHAASNAETAMKHANTNIAIAEKIALDPFVKPSTLLEDAKVEVVRVETEVKKSKDREELPPVSEVRAGDALQAAVDVAKETVIGAAKPEQEPVVEGRPNTLKEELKGLLDTTEVDKLPPAQAVSAQQPAIQPGRANPPIEGVGQGGGAEAVAADKVAAKPSQEAGVGGGATLVDPVAPVVVAKEAEPIHQTLDEAQQLAIQSGRDKTPIEGVGQGGGAEAVAEDKVAAKPSQEAGVGGGATLVDPAAPVVAAKEAEPIHQTLDDAQQLATQSKPVVRADQDHTAPDSNVPLAPPPPPPPLPPAPKMEVEERKPPAPSLPQTPDTLTASQDITHHSQIPKGFVQNIRANFEAQSRTQFVYSSKPGAVLSAPPAVGAQQQQKSVGAGGAGGGH